MVASITEPLFVFLHLNVSLVCTSIILTSYDVLSSVAISLFWLIETNLRQRAHFNNAVLTLW